MPTGSFDLSPVPGGIATQALPIYVCLYSPGSQNPYTVLPNVRCLRIDYREGPEPPVRFQYLTDDLLQDSLGWPAQFEQLWPIHAQGSYVVMTDDRLVVQTQLPPATKDGKPQIVVLFDGFAQVPQADLSAASGDSFCRARHGDPAVGLADYRSGAAKHDVRGDNGRQF